MVYSMIKIIKAAVKVIDLSQNDRENVIDVFKQPSSGKHNVPGFGTTIKYQVKGGQVGKIVAP